MYHRVRNWVVSYEDGGPLPGLQRFFSPLTGNYVQFGTLLDHLIWLDQRWEEEAERIMEETIHTLSDFSSDTPQLSDMSDFIVYDHPEEDPDIDEDAHEELGLFYNLDPNSEI